MSAPNLWPPGGRVNTRLLTPADWLKLAPTPQAQAVVAVLESWFRPRDWQPWPGCRELAHAAGVGHKVVVGTTRKMVAAGLLELSGRWTNSTGRLQKQTARLRYDPSVQAVPSAVITGWLEGHHWGGTRTARASLCRLDPVKPHGNHTDQGKKGGARRHKVRGGVPESSTIPGFWAQRVNTITTHLQEPEVLNMEECPKDVATVTTDQLLANLFDNPGDQVSVPRGEFFRGPFRVRSLDRPVMIPAPGIRFPTPETDHEAVMVLWEAYKDAYRGATGKRYGNWRVKLENVSRQKWYKSALVAWELIKEDGRVHPLIWARWFVAFAAQAAAGKKGGRVLPFQGVFSPKAVSKWLSLCWHQEKPEGRSILTRTHREQWLRRQEAMLLNCGALRPGAPMPDHHLIIQMETCTWYRDIRAVELAAGHTDPNDFWPTLTEYEREDATNHFYSVNPHFQFGDF